MTEKLNTVQYYKELSETYDKKRLGTKKSKVISDFQNEWFVKNLKNTLPIECLEIGCGTGRLTKELIKKTRNLVVTDTSFEMVKINKKKFEQHAKKNNIHYIVCEASRLPFRNKTFAYIVSSRVLWHIRDYTQIFKETLKILKKNGSLLFDFPCLWGPFAVRSKLFGIKHEVLTLFIDSKSVKQKFKNTKNIVMHGNTSMILYFIPERILKMKFVQKTIYFLEIRNVIFLKNWFYTYYLVKVTK